MQRTALKLTEQTHESYSTEHSSQLGGVRDDGGRTERRSRGMVEAESPVSTAQSVVSREKSGFTPLDIFSTGHSEGTLTEQSRSTLK